MHLHDGVYCKALEAISFVPERILSTEKSAGDG